MKTLKFDSVLFGTRYDKNLALPDFIRDENGKIDREKTLALILK